VVLPIVQSGVVVEHINSAEIVLDAGEQLAHLILVGEVGCPRVWTDTMLALVDADHRAARTGELVDGRRHVCRLDAAPLASVSAWLQFSTLSEAAGGATQLTLVHERLEELRAAKPDVAEGIEPGWASVLDKLADAIQQAD
jgi:hypothetical protein